LGVSGAFTVLNDLKPCSEGGFTLIEIVLVIVIISVMTMMVAPSFFSSTRVSVDQEARRLAKALRLASDEATLTGKPIRWSAHTHAYSFESPDAEGAWQLLDERPYTPHHFPNNISMVEVHLNHTFITEALNSDKKDVEPVLGRLLLLPQGIMEPARITLAEQGDGGKRITLLLRPGPGGISIDHGRGG